MSHSLRNVQTYLLRLIVFLVPTQLAIHFWPSWAHMFGIRVDYLSPTIYLTDILILILLSIFVFTSWRVIIKNSASKIRDDNRLTIITLIMLVFIVVNIVLAGNWMIAFLKWGKIMLFFLFYLYIVKRKNLSMKKDVVIPLSFSIITFGMIAAVQYFMQRSVGGMLYLLGERTFSTTTSGIALVSIMGVEKLRAYSTFPHPNALAGYFLVTLLIVVFNKSGLSKLYLGIFIFISLLGIVVSFSKTVYVTILLIGIVYLILIKRKRWFKRVVFAIFLGGIVLSLLLPYFSRKAMLSEKNIPENIYQRFSLSDVSGKLVSDKTINGVGLNNFIINIPDKTEDNQLSWWLQPVHNIYLLTASEIGLVGLVALFILLYKAIETGISYKRHWIVLVLVVIIITGLADHYWLTLQQNLLLLTMIMALTFRDKLLA